MGFMDKAKKLAEQAQTKLEDVQKDFNEKQGSGGDQHAGPGNAVQYDEHGRPKTPDTPQTPADLPATQSADLSQPKGDPLSAEPTAPAAGPPQGHDDRVTPDEPTSADPSPAKVQGDPLLDETEKKPTPPAGGGMTSGDPLG